MKIDNDIAMTAAEISLFAEERIPYDRAERTPYTHAAKLSRNLVAALAAYR